MRNKARPARMSRRSANRSARSAAAPSGSSRSTARPTASGSPAPASIRRPSSSASSSATSRRSCSHARLQRAPVAALLPDHHVPRPATSRRSCSRSSTTMSPKRSAALAATFETAVARRHLRASPASLPAERLATALKPVLAEAGTHLGSAFERDAARRPAPDGEAVATCARSSPTNRRAFLDLLGRVIKRAAADDRRRRREQPPRPRLIVP